MTTYPIRKEHKRLTIEVDADTEILLLYQRNEPAMVYASKLPSGEWFYQCLVLCCRCSSEQERLTEPAKQLYQHAIATGFIANISFGYLA